MSDEPLYDYQSELPADVPPAAGSQPSAGSATPQPGPTAQEPLPPAGSVRPPGGSAPAPGISSPENDRLMAALAWVTLAILQLPVLSVIMLLVENNKNQPFQRYHAVTSIVFWAVAIIYEILASIVYVVLGVVTLGCGLACLWPIFFVPHAIALYYAYEAYMGREPLIPFITEFVRQQRWA